MRPFGATNDMRPFGATNEPDTCLWCGRRLGYLGDGLFCTLSCGYAFGRAFARDLGQRLKPRAS